MLALDTTFDGVGVAISRDGACCVQVFEPKSHQASGRLLPMIQQALDQANLTLKALDGVVVCRGPGSFTGIRLGLATAQSLSLGSGVPWKSVTSFEMLAYAWLQTDIPQPLPEQIWVVADTRGFEMGMVAFLPHEKRFLDPRYGSPQVLAGICDKSASPLITGTGLGRLSPYIKETAWLHSPDPTTFAVHLGAYTFLAPFEGALTENPDPLYGQQGFRPHLG